MSNPLNDAFDAEALYRTLLDGARAALQGQADAAIVGIHSGGAWLADTVRLLVERGIPVCAHIGLTPQFVHQLGGFRVQGKTDAGADSLKNDALALQAASAFSVVLEMVPADVAKRVTGELVIPTIGIGAGPDCDAQVLVWSDMAGMNRGRKPRFVRNFMTGHDSPLAALQSFDRAVRDRSYPAAEHNF